MKILKIMAVMILIGCGSTMFAAISLQEATEMVEFARTANSYGAIKKSFNDLLDLKKDLRYPEACIIAELLSQNILNTLDTKRITGNQATFLLLILEYIEKIKLEVCN